jgi:FkbM family methyltransferase
MVACIVYTLKFFIKVNCFLLGIGYGGFSIKKETKILSKLIVKINLQDPVIFDVGANSGKWTSALKQKLDSKGSFYLFESNNKLVNQLNKKFKKERDIHTFNFGFHETSGVKKFYYPIQNSELGSSFKRRLFVDKAMKIKETRSKFMALDEFVTQSGIAPDVIKLDTEGAEYSILKGGGKSINNVSLLQIEFGGTAIDGNFHFTNIFDFLTKRNFKCYRISFFGLIPILECSTFEEILFPTNYIFMKTQVLK